MPIVRSLTGRLSPPSEKDATAPDAVSVGYAPSAMLSTALIWLFTFTTSSLITTSLIVVSQHIPVAQVVIGVDTDPYNLDKTQIGIDADNINQIRCSGVINTHSI